MEIKVTKKDLIGDLENFPIEVVEKMLQNQYEQLGKTDITVFQHDNDAITEGFIWGNSIEGYDFWNDVIYKKRFDIFFERYPKGSPSKKVYIWGHSTKGNKVIEALKERGGIDRYIGYAGDCTDCIYYIDPITSKIEFCKSDSPEIPVKLLFNMVTTYHEKIEIDEDEVELTLGEIAERLGIDSELLRIKK